MTVKELANVAGCSRDTVLDAIKKTYPEKVHNGITTRLNMEQAKEIMKILPKKNMVEPMENSLAIPMEKSIGLIVSETIKGLLPVIQSMILENNNIILKNINKNQIEYKQDYFTLKGWHLKNKIEMPPMTELRKLGKEAVKLSIEMKLEIKKADDEIYGQVNSYHIDVLKKVFEI